MPYSFIIECILPYLFYDHIYVLYESFDSIENTLNNKTLINVIYNCIYKIRTCLVVIKKSTCLFTIADSKNKVTTPTQLTITMLAVLNDVPVQTNNREH